MLNTFTGKANVQLSYVRHPLKIRTIWSLAMVAILVFAPNGTRAQQAPTVPAELRPSVNFYGLPGLMDMPTAQAQPDGELTTSATYFGGIFRNTLAFQLSPRISGAFRYSIIQDWNSDGFDTYYDRSFDLRYQLLFEGRYRPGVAIGLQDFAGTGILAGEYIVASKTLPQGITVTGGLGWGRLGSYGSIGSPFGSDRPSFNVNDTGGEFSFDQWFRGPVAPFAGIEWRPNERLGLKLEYSSDDYVEETVNRSVFQRRSPWNFGVEYQLSEPSRVGAYYLYGDAIGISASFTFNPARTLVPLIVPAPAPLAVRPDQDRYPELWTTEWTQEPTAQTALGQRLTDVLEPEGFRVRSFDLQPYEAELRVENVRYRSTPNAIGRVARGMALVLPLSVETFRIVLVNGGLPVSTVIVRRTDLETLEPEPDAAERLRPLVGLTAASSADEPEPVADFFPRFEWSIDPYFRQALFDPRNPILLEVGARVTASYEFSPGLMVATSVAQEVYSDLDKIRVSTSNLPPVRTLAGLYEDGSGPVIENLTASYVRSLGNGIYGRATAGYFERMFGGLSGEILWKPVSSPFALGVEINYARQRDFDGLFGFLDYDVFSGHVSAYYDWGNGFHTQVDVGRYLAGDWGATLTIDREFENGWRVGAFATITDVSSEDFGEGSFDKGIRLSIPLGYVSGDATQNGIDTVLRPIQRDGGARLIMPGRLYERVRSGHARRVNEEWARVWR